MLPERKNLLPGLDPSCAEPVAPESLGPERLAPQPELTKPLSVVVHDLRVQIGIVLGYSQLILEEAEATLNSEHREFLGLILAAGRALNGLVEDHLTVQVRKQRLASPPSAVAGAPEASPGPAEGGWSAAGSETGSSP